MPRIHHLPEDVRNRIAAGEVIERPASVVKELIENSLDASADRIEIEIVRAGRRLIRVFDNGTGMDRDDLLKAADRYATSKLKRFEDLQNLASYGFRGEALSSIASVSRMRLISSPREIAGSEVPQDSAAVTGGLGACVEIAGGELRDVRDCASLGTTVEVRDIFFNTPARLKFMRAEKTENSHILDVVMRQSMSNYTVSFQLIMDGREVLCLPPAVSMRERLAQLYGTEYTSQLVEVSEISDDMRLVAFLSRASLARASRPQQYLFVNKRAVRDVSVSHAIYRAYEEFIPHGKHPGFFIFLYVAPERVDVNVHPTKREVRFGNILGVQEFVYRAAHTALKNAHVSGFPDPPDKPDSVTSLRSAVQIAIDAGHGREDGAATDRVSDSSSAFYTGGVASLYLGDTFVAVPTSEGLWIVDYHAAHERINYERILKHGSGSACRLLFPQTVRLDPAAYETLVQNRNLLSSVGFEIDDFGRDSVLVRGVPDVLKDADISAILSDVASSISGIEPENEISAKIARGATSGVSQTETIVPLEERRRAVAARLACHASVRGRDVPDGPRLSTLLRDLDATENPAQCPHGRPTRIVLSLGELKRMFRKN